MPKYVVLRLDIKHLVPQVLRARRLLLRISVEDTGRGTVRDQEVDLGGQLVPNHLLVAWLVLEGISYEVGSVGGAEYADSLKIDHLVLEIDAPLAKLLYDVVSGDLAGGWATLQGYLFWQASFFLADMQPLSRLISWLPAITTLCLKLSLSSCFIKVKKSFSLPCCVKSPAWMKMSPCIPKRSFSACISPWVSDTTTTLSCLLSSLSASIKELYSNCSFKQWVKMRSILQRGRALWQLIETLLTPSQDSTLQPTFSKWLRKSSLLTISTSLSISTPNTPDRYQSSPSSSLAEMDCLKRMYFLILQVTPLLLVRATEGTTTPKNWGQERGGSQMETSPSPFCSIFSIASSVTPFSSSCSLSRAGQVNTFFVILLLPIRLEGVNLLLSSEGWSECWVFLYDKVDTLRDYLCFFMQCWLTLATFHFSSPLRQCCPLVWSNCSIFCTDIWSSLCLKEGWGWIGAGTIAGFSPACQTLKPYPTSLCLFCIEASRSSASLPLLSWVKMRPWTSVRFSVLSTLSSFCTSSSSWLSLSLSSDPFRGRRGGSSLVFLPQLPCIIKLQELVLSISVVLEPSAGSHQVRILRSSSSMQDSFWDSSFGSGSSKDLLRVPL